MLFALNKNKEESECLKKGLEASGIHKYVRIVSDFLLLRMILAQNLPNLKRLEFLGSQSSSTIKQVADILISFPSDVKIVLPEKHTLNAGWAAQ